MGVLLDNQKRLEDLEARVAVLEARSERKWWHVLLFWRAK
jgi:hypothetical protein